ncbi:hypothetical protein [Aquitalea sp. ASV15]|uniref:hypothetical protein n=1 Tax=Aquitalea sp. ASV15 TaxID=2795104 RepID=UPI0018EAEAFB|nr:hypothetical protein [Aquitalea sp. ASV15]
MMMKIVGLLLMLCSGAALAGPVFANYTEEQTTGWAAVSPAVAGLIVRSDADLQLQADEETAEKNLKPGDYRQFFVSRKLPLAADGRTFLFVRPKSSPYFRTFYGAHTFCHWIVDDRNNILYDGNSDAFQLLDSRSNGLKDIQEAQCHGGKCYLVKLSFKAGKYQETSCSTQDIDSGKLSQGCDAGQ